MIDVIKSYDVCKDFLKDIVDVDIIIKIKENKIMEIYIEELENFNSNFMYFVLSVDRNKKVCY